MTRTARRTNRRGTNHRPTTAHAEPAAADTLTLMPYVPPIRDGETLPSWIDRIAAANHLPLGSVLQRLGLTDPTRRLGHPAAWGIDATDHTLNVIAATTGTPTDRLRAALLTTYNGGPITLTINHDKPGSVGRAVRTQWLYGSGSHYCPSCLHDTGGVWLLTWRLPWTFACTTHHELMQATCPGCDRRSGRARPDGTTTPTFTTHIPRPTRCGNALTGQAPSDPQARPGRAAQPCGYDLTCTPAQPLTDPATATPVLHTQHALTALLTETGQQHVWQDLRAVTALILTVSDTDTIAALANLADYNHLNDPVLADAVTEHLNQRSAAHDARQLLIAGGRDGRHGPRLRLWTTTPASPALMAAVAPLTATTVGLTQAANTGLADAMLTALAHQCRKAHRDIRAFLTDAHASDQLRDRADRATTATQSLAHQLRAEPTRPAVETRHIPAYIAETHADPFLRCFHGTGTRPDTVRKFAALAAVKALTGTTWVDAAVTLGHPARPIPSLTANLVHRLTRAGTHDAFRAAVTNYLDTIASNSDAPDYTQRRQTLRTFRLVPSHTIRAGGLVATETRRRNAAAWLWSDLTGGHPYEAPAWGSRGANENQREVYRRFTNNDLPKLHDALDDLRPKLVSTPLI